MFLPYHHALLLFGIRGDFERTWEGWVTGDGKGANMAFPYLFLLVFFYGMGSKQEHKQASHRICSDEKVSIYLS